MKKRDIRERLAKEKKPYSLGKRLQKLFKLASCLYFLS
ncbi:hypothetical protein DW1_0060 [Proteiniborus sp. DW1]|nr:hypothetical protein DW1_0060 [Proteiniborus sp. DW1]